MNKRVIQVGCLAGILALMAFPVWGMEIGTDHINGRIIIAKGGGHGPGDGTGNGGSGPKDGTGNGSGFGDCIFGADSTDLPDILLAKGGGNGGGKGGKGGNGPGDGTGNGGSGPKDGTGSGSKNGTCINS